MKFLDFWVVGWRFTKFLMSYIFETTSQFFFKLCIAFQCHGRWVFCTFFGWNFIWFLQKEATTVQNFRLLTAQMKFHQIRTLIGYFCWKYIKFQLKKFEGFMSHDTKEWCKIWRETYFLFQKWKNLMNFDPSAKPVYHCQ